MQRKMGSIVIECVEGDITDQQGFDAVVNAANSNLRAGGGVAGAIHRAAGPELDRACRPLAPIRPGDAVITPAFALPNKYVIHCLGPVYGRYEPAEELLASCYRRALELAEEHRIKSIAFPAISTGVFGYPLPEAARIAVSTVIADAAGHKHLRHICFVLWGIDALGAYESVLQSVVGFT